MITRDVWLAGFGLLQEFFKWAPSPMMAALYLEQLSAELDDDGFTDAVKFMVRTGDRSFGYTPSVADVLAAARGDAKTDDAADARTIFHAIRAAAEYTAHGYRIARQDVEQRHGTAALKAFDAVGGERRLLETDARFVGPVVTEFVAVYVAATAAERAGAVFTRITGKSPEPRAIGDRRAALAPVRDLLRIEDGGAAKRGAA